MKLRPTALVLSAALALLAACGGDGHDHSHDDHSHDDHDHAHDDHDHSHDGAELAADATAPSENATVHALKCGCAIESVGHCAEYIEVDGDFVVLEAPIDLGYMPFCRKDGLQARVDGELLEGSFVASTFAYVD